jgi:hypothetical protein
MKYSASSFSGAAAAADAFPFTAAAADADAFPFTAADAPHDYDALLAGDLHGAEAFMDYNDGAEEEEEDFQGGGVKRFTKRRPRLRLRRKYSDSHTKKSKKMKKRRIIKRSRKNK